MRSVTPIVHPAAILRGQHHLEGAQIAYLTRLAQSPGRTPLDPNESPPGWLAEPTLAQLSDFTYLVRRQHQMVSFDVENAGPHLVCCGVFIMDPELLLPTGGVCFRFRKCGGDPWWPTWEEHLRAVELLYLILADPEVAKVGHFSTMHDIPLLEHLGFDVKGRLIDTAALLHAVHSELPKGLNFNATLFCGAPWWKDVADAKEPTPEEEGE